jgi:hypothetical protein
MIQKMFIIGSCVIHLPELKKELRSKSAPVSVYTFKNSKILTVDRNVKFISEIISILV